MLRGAQQSFGPVAAPGARALILGTYPSPKSFEQGFYYGHPQNRFWPLLARLAGRQQVPADVPGRRQLVLAMGLALWDVLARCRITGAADASIRDAEPNDVAGLVRQLGIQAVFCNGAQSHRLYRRHCQAAAGIEAVCLPSTSPANAAWSLERLAIAWAPVADFMAPPGSVTE